MKMLRALMSVFYRYLYGTEDPGRLKKLSELLLEIVLLVF
jgi:hypothetical protein